MASEDTTSSTPEDALSNYIDQGEAAGELPELSGQHLLLLDDAAPHKTILLDQKTTPLDAIPLRTVAERDAAVRSTPAARPATTTSATPVTPMAAPAIETRTPAARIKTAPSAPAPAAAPPITSVATPATPEPPAEPVRESSRPEPIVPPPAPSHRPLPNQDVELVAALLVIEARSKKASIEDMLTQVEREIGATIENLDARLAAQISDINEDTAELVEQRAAAVAENAGLTQENARLTDEKTAWENKNGALRTELATLQDNISGQETRKQQLERLHHDNIAAIEGEENAVIRQRIAQGVQIGLRSGRQRQTIVMVVFGLLSTVLVVIIVLMALLKGKSTDAELEARIHAATTPSVQPAPAPPLPQATSVTWTYQVIPDILFVTDEMAVDIPLQGGGVFKAVCRKEPVNTTPGGNVEHLCRAAGH